MEKVFRLLSGSVHSFLPAAKYKSILEVLHNLQVQRLRVSLIRVFECEPHVSYALGGESRNR